MAEALAFLHVSDVGNQDANWNIAAQPGGGAIGGDARALVHNVCSSVTRAGGDAGTKLRLAGTKLRLAGTKLRLAGTKLRLAGTWKMVDAASRDADGKPLRKPFGPKGMGLVTFNADGRMMAVLCDGRDSLPNGAKADYASYCGNYTFDGTTLITEVDASATARIAIGSQQVRNVRFEGKRLVLIPPPAELDGVMRYREIFWERISTEPA